MLGTLLSFGTAAYNNETAEKREARARLENFRYGEKAAENADRRTRGLYQDLQSPQALLSQYKEAGLSPSLMFSGGGSPGGTTTGAMGTGAGGVSPTTYGTEAIDPMSEAQIANIVAQTEKTKAETETIKGENDRGGAEIAKIWAEAGATKAAEALTKAETAYKKIQVEIADKTKEFSITRAKYDSQTALENATKAFWEAEDEGLKYQYNKETFAARAQKAGLEAAELISRINVQNSQAELNEEQKNAVADYVKQGYIECAARANNAQEYAKYVEGYVENLPKQLAIKEKEINLEKWRIGTEVFNNVIRTAGYAIGASQLGDGGYQMDETEVTQEGNRHVETERKVKKVKLPKRIPRIR